MSFSRGDKRQPFIYIQKDNVVGTPCVWIDTDYGDHHDLIHDEMRGRTRHLNLGHYNPVIQDQNYGFLHLGYRQLEHYPITIGDERMLEYYYDGTPIPSKLTNEVYQNLWRQLCIYNLRIEKKTSQNKAFRNKMGLVYVSHRSWILKAAMNTENYIQNPFWWQRRTLWQNFIKFSKK